MSEGPPNTHRQQQLYWAQMVELKIACVYTRRYRDHLGKWVTRIGAVRAIASSASIAAWAVWKNHAFLWAVIIASSQVLDALKDVFPVTKKHKSASEHTTTLEGIFIDAQLEWEGIFLGRYTDDQIMKRRHKLMTLQHHAEGAHFPNGLPTRDSDFALAQQEAANYFTALYGAIVQYN